MQFFAALAYGKDIYILASTVDLDLPTELLQPPMFIFLFCIQMKYNKRNVVYR